MTHEETHTPEIDIPQESFEGYLHWWSVAEDFNMDDLPQKRTSLQNSIASTFRDHDIFPWDITSEAERLHSENFIIVHVWESACYFDIYSERFCGYSLSQAQEFRESNPTPEIQTILTGIPVLQELLIANSQTNYWNSFLDENDTVSESSETPFAGLTAKQLQMTLRQNIEIFERRWWLEWISESQKREIQDPYTLYMEMVMGIWEEYEDASGYFYKTSEEIDMYVTGIVYSKESFEDCTSYYRYIQTRISDNKRTSKKNKQAHEILSQKLWQRILERFRKDYEEAKSPDEQMTLIREWLDFVKLITGRSDIDVDRKLRNPGLAEEFCIFILARKEGVFDTIENCTSRNLHFIDPEVWNRKPSDVVDATSSKLREIGIDNPDTFLRNQLQISLLGIIQPEGIESYEDLSLTHKREISILARFLKKLESWEFSPETIEWLDASQIQEKLLHTSEEIYSEAYQAVQEAYDRNFDTSERGRTELFSTATADIITDQMRDIWVSSEDLEAFTLFNDIRWNDGNADFNFSDENLNFAWSLGKSLLIIWATIAVVMITTWWVGFALTGSQLISSLIVANAAGTGFVLNTAWSLTAIWIGASTGTLASIGVIDPRKHDSRWEMIADVATDFAVNTFHAWALEYWLLRYGTNWSLLQKSWYFWADLASWVGIEVLREMSLNAIFQGEPLLTDYEWANISFDQLLHRSLINPVLLGISREECLAQLAELNIWERFLRVQQEYEKWNDGTINFRREGEFTQWYDNNPYVYEATYWAAYWYEDAPIPLENTQNFIVSLERWITRQEQEMNLS